MYRTDCNCFLLARECKRVDLRIQAGLDEVVLPGRQIPEMNVIGLIHRGDTFAPAAKNREVHIARGVQFRYLLDGLRGTGVS